MSMSSSEGKQVGFNETRNLIMDIAQREGLSDVTTELQRLDDKIRIRVGFLGEWNSGKSSLINALIGRKVLPVKASPTTGNIIEVEAKDGLKEPQYFELIAGSEPKVIDAMTFSEIAKGNRSGKALIRVPSSEVIKEGFLLIDTPGLSSLNKTHTDITYGYLPLLDGAIICRDINEGELSKVIIDFVKDKNVQPFSGRFIFALTKADTKVTTKAIISKIIKQLRRIVDKNESPLPLDERVIAISAEKALEGDPKWSLKQFEKAFKTCFVDSKEDLMISRLNKEIQRIGNYLLISLETMLKGLSFDDSEFKKQQEIIETEIANLNEFINAEKERFERSGNELRNRLYSIANNFVPRFKVADQNTVEQVGSEFCSAIQKEAEEVFKQYNIDNKMIDVDVSNLTERIKQIIKGVDFGVMVATAVVAAVITAGVSSTATAATEAEVGAEAAATEAAATEIAATEAVATEAAATGAAVFGKELLGLLANVVKKINPLEYAGDWVANLLKAKSASSLLPQVASNVAQQITSTIKSKIDDEVLLPLKHELEAKKAGLREIWKVRSEKMDEFTSRKGLLKKDIDILRNRLIK